MSEGATPTQWKTFFISLGVNEGIEINRYEKRLSNEMLIGLGFNEGYFEHSFSPFVSTFAAYEYKDLITLALANYSVENIQFSKPFWKDIIEVNAPQDLEKPATAFWGRPGMAGNTTGNEVANYPKWFIENVSCLPTTTNECLNAKVIFLNEESTIKVAGKYLPVFDGPMLSADWRAFFGFKPRLELEDYLLLLTKMAEDPRGDNKIRTQSIYEYFLDNISSWSDEKQSMVKEWSKTGRLADSSGNYKQTSELKYYADGDYSIFGNSYSFIHLSVATQRHPDIENLLGLFHIEILRQREFKLNASDDLEPSSLKGKLSEVIPFWAKWMEKERQNGYDEMLYDLQRKFDDLEILGASEMFISYGKDWQKKVTVHHTGDRLFVLNPWSSAKVMYTLTDKLCEIFQVKKYSNEIMFLLKSEISEIKDHFADLGIGLPPLPENATEHESSKQQLPEPIPVEVSFGKGTVDYDLYHRENLKRNAPLIEKFRGSPSDLLLNGLRREQPDNELRIYHFSHIENAVSIIQEAAIKSRKVAIFKDSAGSGIIAQTDEARKEFARFYFRPKTPTQYYVENLGRGLESTTRIGSDPICPVPVFFVIPLEEAMKHSEWCISTGSFASPQSEYGNDIETISKFDFDGVYKNLPQIASDRFLIAAHQEFLVKNELDLRSIDYHLAVQDEYAKSCLIAMLGNDAGNWEDRIIVDTTLYNQQNPKVNINITGAVMSASLSKEHGGLFMLQHSSDQEWVEIAGQVNEQYNCDGWITTFSKTSILIKGNLQNIKYKVFYFYKGRIWLIHSNTVEYGYNVKFVYAGLNEWFQSQDADITGLFEALKVHPELSYWFGMPVGGPDGLSLQQHTISVIDNYLGHFEGKQRLFSNEKEYLLCLALHDLGKPGAVAEGNRNLQHTKTLEIISRLREIFPVSDNSMHKMYAIINADPIGKYLNPATNQSIENTLADILDMGKKIGVDFGDFLSTLIMYFQCDAAGYNSLRNRLFLKNGEVGLRMNENRMRLIFSEEYEAKFRLLLDGLHIIND